MITNLPGYLLNECLHEGVDTVIYRGRSKSDFSTVIVKTIKAQYPTIKAITCLRHEYKILQALNHIPGIAKAHSLEKYGNSSALILEDFWGISFKQLLTLGKLPVLSFLPIAIQLAAILDGIHKNYIIHKDINPRNILLDPDKLTVKLIDFSIASWLSKENPCMKNADKLEGTLAYISPEQTGRINRAVDYRTDFYSLGVTCYEMVTGRLPFTTTDALELVHCHIAKNPIPPHEIDPEIPQAVSDIVLKLMSKNAEDRYQNALALKADLETCLYQLQSQGEITKFPVGELDQSSQFLIPQKLYGRKNEVRSLLAAFRQVRAGSKEFMLVSGEFGIGKTSIVNEIHKTIVQQGGYFISGKFDQLETKIPQTVFIQILQELIQQILTESPEKFANWQQKILKALGQNGQVIIDVIPALEHIIGSQPPVTKLATTEAQNRLHRILLQFFDVVAQPEHPLVLFLDDLQWADAASLKLIENLICNPETKYLLLIGAYRDSEVSSNHPTIITIEKIYFCKARVYNIVLQPLNFDDTYELISDTYNNQLTNPQQEEKIRELSQLIYHKTQGNPFFITQILQRLDAEGLIYFDFAKRQWQWEIKEIQAIEISDRQIVDLIVSNIKKLPDATQQFLQLAACMGHQFTLENLAIASKTSIQNTAKMLGDALQSGVILPVLQTYQVPQHRQADDVPVTYKFLCDRLQQTIYSLIPDDQKPKMHLSIGRLVVYIFNTFIRPWQEHGREIIPAFVEALEMNLAAGNIEYAGYSSVNYCHYIFLLGENLEHVQDSQKRYIDLMQKLKQEQAIQSISIVRQTVDNLLGESANPCCLIGESFNEAEVVNSINPLFMVYFYKAMLQYFFAEYDESVKNAELAEKYAASCFGFMGLATHSFYYCLALLAIYPNQHDSETQKQILKKVEIHQQKISNWLAHAPENYQHKYELIAAEKARVLGSNLKAIAHYKAAIKEAAKSGYTQEEALANELIAEFYFTCNQVTIAEVFLIKAYYGYIHWGAKAKVKHLESRYPGFFSRILHRESTSVDINQIPVTSKFRIPLVALEIAAVTKALEIIESEDNFEQLLAKLMLITIKASGASKGVLLLLKDGKLQPMARSFSVLTVNNELAIKDTKSSAAFEYEVSLLSPPSKAEPLLDLPVSLINYVERTQKAVLLNNARIEGIFINDPYILQNQPKSIYCCPLIHHRQFIGLIYLENNLSIGAFTNAGLEVLKLLASQASISLL